MKTLIFSLVSFVLLSSFSKFNSGKPISRQFPLEKIVKVTISSEGSYGDYEMSFSVLSVHGTDSIKTGFINPAGAQWTYAKFGWFYYEDSIRNAQYTCVTSKPVTHFYFAYTALPKPLKVTNSLKQRLEFYANDTLLTTVPFPNSNADFGYPVYVTIDFSNPSKPVSLSTTSPRLKASHHN